MEIPVANLINIKLYVPKHMEHCASSDSTVSIIDTEQFEKKRCHMLTTVQSTAKPLVQKNGRADTSNTYEIWRDTVNTPSENAAHQTWFINMPEQFQEMWDGHFGKISSASHRVKLFSPEPRPTHAVPYHVGSKVQAAERRDINKMFPMKVIEASQTEWALPIVFIRKKNETLRCCVDSRKRDVLATRESFR